MFLNNIFIEHAIIGIDLRTECNLGDEVVGFKSNDKVFDLHSVISEGIEVQPVLDSDEEYLHFLRHDAAHVLAQALTVLFPKIQFGKQFFEGKFIFAFDVYLPEYNFSSEDFPKIENEMRNVIAQEDDIIKHIVEKSKALERFADDKFKQDIINHSSCDSVVLYEHGDYIDICHGPRGLNNKYVKYFKLLNVQEVSWLYDEKIKLQRILGACFADETSMKQFLLEKEKN
ncbi:MAG: hypothetical protein H6845_00170 [Alphaproteobacteria bacterium]|nr:MAG: hypothetical protein H6845_00170 [Alphaproteobacteria bacterium]